MKKILLFLATFILLLHSGNAQKPTTPAKSWTFEAGPYIGIPAWSFAATHTFGFGADAKATTDLGGNFSAGGEFSYGYFFGEKAFGVKTYNFNMVGLYVNLQYTYLEKFVAGGGLGLGVGFAGGASGAGFARTGYLGYKFRETDHPITVALYLNRTTAATYNIGLKTWYQF